MGLWAGLLCRPRPDRVKTGERRMAWRGRGCRFGGRILGCDGTAAVGMFQLVLRARSTLLLHGGIRFRTGLMVHGCSTS